MGTIDTIPEWRGAIDSDARQRHRRPKAFAASIIERMAVWSEKRSSRRALRALSVDQLRDIGLTRAEVRREVAKSFFWE
ncbi:DUF1127 domain-containing protein [Rhizobium tumorigenes]|uniref:DUF1127 domain-containing protein n=1 Tax=Rhizobium tumorigenes TaxID=2041385 RepID=UPI00241D8CCD|nr:DUF1127 domain-containing protein [Rhizobium tumorigenes]WFS02505.1 DUF1127 domain-containing protein [Rhizobium tumorigenes]